jgi:hypothetical protein
MEQITALVARHPLMFVTLAALLGAWLGMFVMACAAAAGRADDEAEHQRTVYGDKVVCCNHNCNQGDDCPLREGA